MLALDTNILVALQKLEPEAVRHYQLALRDDQVVVSAVVRFEARRSLLRPEHSRRLARLDTLLSGHGTLEFDQQAADLTASLYDQLRAAGALIDDADLLIAATAVRHGATLVTRNVKHFSRIPGLSLTDWHKENPTP